MISNILCSVRKGVKLMNAFDIARIMFRNRFDKAGNPYIEHCKFVGDNAYKYALFLSSSYDAETVRDAGYLHDVLEDTDMTSEELREYGITDRVISIVKALTHDKSVPYDDYIDGLIDSGNTDAVLVKFADMTNNMDINRYPIEIRNDEAVKRRMNKYERNIKKLSSYLLGKKVEILKNEHGN